MHKISQKRTGHEKRANVKNKKKQNQKHKQQAEEVQAPVTAQTNKKQT